MKTKEKMNSTTLHELATDRSALMDTLRNFNPSFPSEKAPTVAHVTKGGAVLDFLFGEDGRCTKTPPNFSWALAWPWRELKKYFKSKRLEVSSE